MPGPAPSRSTRVSRRIPRTMSRPRPPANRLACPIPKGTTGPPAPRITRPVQRRGGGRRGIASQLRPPLAASLGPRRLLPGGPGRARAQARFFPLATRPSSRPSPVRPSARPTALEPPVAADLAARASTALGKPISRSTVWRILDADAIKPWQYEYWIFPRDPHFAEKAGPSPGPVRGLLARTSRWAPRTTSSAPTRRPASRPASAATRRCRPRPGRPMRVEPEYERGGALQYLAAWDVRRGLGHGPVRGARPGSSRSAGWSSR